MNFQFEMTRRLSREHQEVAALLGRFEQFLAGGVAEPDWQEAGVRRLLSDLKGALEGEIPRHFQIEEQELFPLFARAGGEDMVALLEEDHRLILGLLEQVRPPVLRALREGNLEPGEWETLRVRGRAFATELAAHADKEEFGFVPALEEMLEPDEDRRIQMRYLSMA